MAGRDSTGLVTMTVVFMLLMGGIGGFVYLRYRDGGAGRGATSSRSLIEQARTRANRGDFASALDLLTAAVEADPRSPEPHVARGEVSARSGDRAAAIEDFDRALELDPASAPALSARAAVRAAGGEVDLAIEDYTRAIEFDPENAAIRQARGRVERRIHRYRAAADDLARARRTDPDRRGIDQELAWAQWGAGDYDGALASFDRAVGRASPTLHDFFGRGVTLYHLGRLREARANLERAADFPRRGSGFDYASYYLWLTTMRLGEPAEAEEILRRLLDPARAPALGPWSREIARFLLGRRTEAEFLEHAAAARGQPAPQQLCEAYFYAGSVRRLAGDAEGAADLFRRCRATGIDNYYEYFSARAELARPW